MEPKWLEWSRQLQAVAQNGIAYSKDRFDVERFEQVRRVASEIMACHAGVEADYVRGLFAEELGPATPKVDV
ncbi:MAG: NUDIX hydrolase N-terminal domain-containing protein, partial [Candidatus Glassbacteria bacterium]|nr:NUDIX hydrolase N-terminal domain-containing protein [Candidatus Glassbacteria bacterium]